MVAFMVAPIFFFFSTYIAFYSLGVVYPPLVYVQLVYVLLYVVVTIALLVVAQRDAEARQLLVRHHIAKQQLATLQRQIAVSSARGDGMRKLRHDLANQVDVVRGLAERGDYEDADAYLADLQGYAARLATAHGIDAAVETPGTSFSPVEEGA